MPKGRYLNSGHSFITTSIIFLDASRLTSISFLPLSDIIAKFTTDAVLNVGIFNGCFYEDPTTAKPTWKNYWPASVAAEAQAFVYDNPDDLFEVQSSGTITRAKVGRAVDMGYTEGSTINGRSKEELGTTVGSGLALRIIRISEDPSNSDIANDNANWIVKFNEHIYYNYEA